MTMIEIDIEWALPKVKIANGLESNNNLNQNFIVRLYVSVVDSFVQSKDVFFVVYTTIPIV